MYVEKREMKETNPKNKFNSGNYEGNTIILVLLAFAITQTASLLITVLFGLSETNNWFGLNVVANQMSFCLHPIMIYFVIVSIIMSLLLDHYILKDRYSHKLRIIFWVVIAIIIVSRLYGHYATINVLPYDESIFQFLKPRICY
jgi:hypothetical protein